MAVSDFSPPGYGDKQAVRILTVDRKKRRIECALRDGAAVYAAVWEVPNVFRWPKTGEVWTIRKDAGIWRLDSLVQDTDKINNAALSDLEEGEAQVNAEVLRNTKGARFLTGTDSLFESFLINVKLFGAVGDGVTDDTAAIDEAVDHMLDLELGGVNGGPWLDGPPLYFPAGRYVYNGAKMINLTGVPRAPHIFGDGAGQTEIILASGAFLLDGSAGLHQFHLHDLAVSGGAGIFRSTNTGINVLWQALVQRCIFNGYTVCAFDINSSDWPFWVWEDCFFAGQSASGGPIAIASVNSAASMDVIRCQFFNNKIDIKAGAQGNGLHVHGCGFVPGGYPTGGGRIPIWILPTPDTGTGGIGLDISDNKFGNEGKVAGDYVIVYAEEGAGATVGVRQPVLGADSTGNIIGHKIGPNEFAGSADWVDGNAAYIYSTTKNVYALDFGPILAWGSTPNALFKLRTAAGFGGSGQENTLGPLYGSGARIQDTINVYGDYRLINPTGMISSSLSTKGSSSVLGIPTVSDVIFMTGTTNITDMLCTDNDEGRIVTIIFEGVLTVSASGTQHQLAGNFTTSANDTLTVACKNSKWFEVTRSVN